MWVRKYAPRSTKKGNNFRQLEHLKLKGLKIKTISVFCRDQSVFRESYYGTKHNSSGQNNSGSKHNSGGQGNSGGAWNSRQVAPLRQRLCQTFEVYDVVLYEPQTTVTCVVYTVDYGAVWTKQKKCEERIKRFAQRKLHKLGVERVSKMPVEIKTLHTAEVYCINFNSSKWVPIEIFSRMNR